jgi:hypothetical protein
VKSPFKSKGDYEYAMRKLGEAIGDVAYGTARRATAYISPTLTMKATAQRKQDKRARYSTVLVTVGTPNFVERRFIKVCQKAGMCFPLNQIQWRAWPKKGGRK